MGGNRTFTMIKPDAMGNAYAGKIIDHIINNGFTLTTTPPAINDPKTATG